MAYIGNVVTSFNVATQNINNDAITTEKIADGAILNADVNSAAAIAGTKISPDFGSQNIATTGLFSHALGTAAAPTITFTGDPNTGIYSPGADQVAISTNGTGRLFVDSAGNVGVGTTTAPGSNGKGIAIYDASFPRLSFRNSTTGDANTDGTQMLMNGNNFIIANTENGYTSFENNGTERMRLTSAGLLGIGTTSPAGKLEVSTGNAEGLRLSAPTYLSTSEGPWVAFNGGPSAGWDTARVQGIRLGSGFEGGLIFFTNSGSSAGSVVERARIDNSGRLLVGTSTARSNIYMGNASDTPKFQLEASGDNYSGQVSLIQYTSIGTAPTYTLGISKSNTPGTNALVASGDTLGTINFVGNDGTNFRTAAQILCGVDGTPGTNDMPGRLVFSTTADGASSPTERMRIDSSGRCWFNTTIGDETETKSWFFINGNANNTSFSAYGYQAVAGNINRSNDGALLNFRSAGVTQGTISVSGTTVSYNGAHLSRWSQLPGGAVREEILRGTVLSNIDEMCDWGEEDNEQLNRMKVSDVEGDPNVSGVFQAWDDDDDTYTDDFYCAMTGDFIIRIAEGTPVHRGQLLMSAGDGTAKPQDDDIIRSKTIAKVTSNHVTCTYDDGSYCVPCVLMAC